MASTLMMRMMGLRYPLKIPQGKERRAYQQETMWMDCNSVFPSDDHIGMMARLRSLARFEDCFDSLNMLMQFLVWMIFVLVQPFSPTNDIAPTPIYLSQEAMDSVGVKFPYLIPKKLKEGQELRRVAQLDWKIIENDCQKPFVASGLELVPLPVMHGEDYISLGFLFGEKCKVAYISDVSRILPTTEHYISKNSDQQLDLLILDTLYKKGSHNTHFCFPQTLDAVKKLCPKRALLIGMTHEFDYHVDNEFLREWSKREGIPVQLARDGLRIPIDL
ncbi:hypothetical protein HYC85_018125 [Camellia sinensis]|uniref:Metallo-beta-lactamase domain-containing protein n=1 Tax=Camellia sinensis TaxID=4442 RepID=A0A7J7GXB7_CAMSI|nr:hypothetical protein HYC85_018125 [Camellia sinensis]